MSGRTSQLNEHKVDLGKPSLSRDEPRSSEHPQTTHTDVKGCDTCSDIKEVRNLTREDDLS